MDPEKRIKLSAELKAERELEKELRGGWGNAQHAIVGSYTEREWQTHKADAAIRRNRKVELKGRYERMDQR